LIDKAYDHCTRLLKEDEQKLHAVVEFLLANESMTGAQFAQCMEGQQIQKAGGISMFDDLPEV